MKWKKSAKRFKKHFRKRFSKKRKTFRKKSRTVYGRKTVAISRRHLRPKREQLYQTYFLNVNLSIQTAAQTWTPIWSTTGVDVAAQPFLVGPYNYSNILAAGTAAAIATAMNNVELDHGINGRVWMYSMLDLRFIIDQPFANGLTNAPLVTNPRDYFRLLILKQRVPQLTSPLDIITANYNLNTPILTKDWNILYDKQFTWDTGLSIIPYPAVIPDYVLGVNGIRSKPKQFRFKFPFKYRAEYRNINLGGIPEPWAPPLNTYVLIFSTFGQILINNIVCRQYFTQSK